MSRTALALASTAIAVAAVDLGHKATVDATYFHSRSSGYVVFVVLGAALWAGTILATGSLSLALAGGIVAGGAIGNLASLAFWPGVPNPLVLEPIAFNLADVFVLAGFVLTAAATLVFATRNRERLSEPIRLR
jgi:lipoprotein signal peptidase